MINNNISVQNIVDFLNELLEIDNDMIQNICLNRIECNEKLANHLTVQVDLNKETKKYSVGLIGILNGLVGSFDEGKRKGWGCISADCKILELDGMKKYKIKKFHILKNNDNTGKEKSD